jgi:phosphatidylinositol glycan class V
MASMSVFRVAVLSRVATLTLMFAFDALVDDYDTSGALEPEGLRVPASFACRRLEGVVTWDSVYFARVASEGYEHEQAHAFFPLLPALMRLLAFGSRSRCALAASGLLVSNLAHVASAVTLERLGTLVLDDPAAARTAATLFALNPASVFHSAAYTESLFACLSLAGCLALALPRARPNLAALAFALACAARSNGALNLAFLAHDFAFARVGAAAWFGIRARREKPRRPTVGYETTPLTDRLAATVAFAARVSVAVAPLLAAQALGYRTYCLGQFSDASPNRHYADNPRPWCDRWRPFPNIYAFVQSEYWNVGFLRYYEPRQMPNFALAAPALGASAAAAMRWVAAATSGGKKMHPHPAAWAVMAVAAALVMHVQVATRFLSATPAPYWFLAKEGKTSEATRRATCAYFLAFGLLGTLMFPTFYPWT